jgi:hypothetical protein
METIFWKNENKKYHKNPWHCQFNYIAVPIGIETIEFLFPGFLNPATYFYKSRRIYGNPLPGKE